MGEAITPVTVTRRRFTADEYQCMGQAGILHEDERVELLEGEIFVMAPIGGRHVWCVTNLSALFGAMVLGRAIVSVQNPVRLSRHSEPQPDIALLRPRYLQRRGELPTPEDVLLLIEVADTSIGYDRHSKHPLFAAAGIGEVWIVDLTHDRIEVYREPANGAYQNVTTFARGSALSPVAFPDVALSCDEVLP